MGGKIFIQRDGLTEYVIPLMRADYIDDEKCRITKHELFGTAFLIGNQGFALTAAHVIDQIRENYDPKHQVILTHFFNLDGVFPFQVYEFEKHPTEDIGIVKINCENLKSFLRISEKLHNSSAQYTGWGYPIEIAEELKHIKEDFVVRPDLVYIEGYIRRTINTELSSSVFKGSKYYEISDLGGGGFSGAPIILRSSVGRPFWDIIGVYIGEKEGSGASVGYVVRADAFSNWKPTMLDCTVYEESLKG